MSTPERVTARAMTSTWAPSRRHRRLLPTGRLQEFVPDPRTVWTNRGRAGSSPSFSRSLAMWTSTVRSTTTVSSKA
jgi:hypothetical protein